MILFIPHGAGPLPLIEPGSHPGLRHFLRKITARIPRPEAILVISAHWEAAHLSVLAQEKPGLYYDYHGFPDAAYTIEYPLSVSSSLLNQLIEIVPDIRLETQRGFDHGVFVPLKIMYPEADIPCVQLSLLSSLDAKEHIAIGKKLAALNQENILILGSGFSFHHIGAFMRHDAADDYKNEGFQNFLIDTCCQSHLTATEREQALINWSKAEYAQFCHPSSEHLMPLLVCQAAAGCSAELVFDEPVLGKRCIALYWDV